MSKALSQEPVHVNPLRWAPPMEPLVTSSGVRADEVESWRELAGFAASTVGAGLLAGVDQYPNDGGAEPLTTVASWRSAEAFLHFVDAAPTGWISDESSRTANALCDRVAQLDALALLGGFQQ